MQHYTADFNVERALRELFKYANQYSFEVDIYFCTYMYIPVNTRGQGRFR